MSILDAEEAQVNHTVAVILWVAGMVYCAILATAEGKPPREGMDKPMTEAMGRHWRAVLYTGASIAYGLGAGILR